MEHPFLRLVRPDDDDLPERQEQKEVFDYIDVLNNAAVIRATIGTLAGFISNNALAAAQQLVNTYSVPELQSHIMNSTENDWKIRPAFYIAVCDRYYVYMKDFDKKQ